MRDHAKKFSNEILNDAINDGEEEEEDLEKSEESSGPGGTRNVELSYFREDGLYNRNYNLHHHHHHHQELLSTGEDYYRDCLMNIEDQVETSKLVLQLVTDSRFNMTQINGQRKLGGPPPGWKGPPPGAGCEVFVGKIPRTLYEHEIYPIFRRMGEVYEIRLMMDFSGTNRGYCFVMFGKPEYAQRAITELDNFEIRPGRRIGVVASINNCRLYVGQLPPDVTSEIVIRKIYDITDDVGQVAVYRNANDQARYALISYKTHRGAAMARRRLVPDRASLFGGAEVSIDWAHPSMFPSNVVEDTGICDDDGNIEISRVVVGSENKRCQNRRRVRDDFLDHSIRAYLQTDRAMENLTRNKKNPTITISNSLQNQNLNNLNTLGGMNRGVNNSFHVFDKNSNPKSQNYSIQKHNNYPKSIGDKNRGKIEISRKSRDSNNSSFDLNLCSGSSESSGCSSQSSASERYNNLSKESFSESPIMQSNFYSNSKIFYPVDNEDEIFSDNDKILGDSSRSSDSGDQKLGERKDSLNLFDNYTFSVNCPRDAEKQGDFNDLQNNGDDFSSINFDNNLPRDNQGEQIHGEIDFFQNEGENFLPKITTSKDFLEVKHEHRDSKTHRENDRKLREQRVPKSIKYNSKLQNFEDIESFSKTIGSPIKNENFKPFCAAALDFANFSRSQNRNGVSPLVWNKNGKNSSSSTSAARCGFVAENCPIQQQIYENCGNNRFANKNSNLSNFRHFSNPNNTNFDTNKNGVLLSAAQVALNAYDLSSTNLGGNISPVNTNPTVYIDSGYPSGNFIPQGNNSQVMNFYPGQNFSTFIQNCPYQSNKKFLNVKNSPKNGGRPILSRSYLCNENQI